MSHCPDCNSKFGFINVRTPYEGREICYNCYSKITAAKRNPNYEQDAATQNALNEAINGILLTTETAPSPK